MGENPFEVLGVPVDADDVALRRAYARKVREHPPEADADGFQRVCDAYEMLRDPARRASIAAGLEQPELARLLMQYRVARAAGDREVAWETLESIVLRFPGETQAREEQVRFLLATGRVDDAMKRAESWVVSEPTRVEPLLLLADLRLASEQPERARKLADALVALAPGDRRSWLMRVRALIELSLRSEALEAIGEALKLPAGHVTDPQLIGRRILLLAEENETERIDAELARLEVAATTEEQRRSTAGLFTSLAGWVLSNGKPGRVVTAEKLFSKARGLDPKGHQFVLEDLVELKLKRMSSPVQEHVARLREEKPREIMPIAGKASWNQLLGCAGLIAVVLAIVGVGSWLRHANQASVVAVVVLFATLLYWFFRKGSYDYLELRPMHLIRVHGDTVTVVPLLRVVELSVIGNSTVSIRLESGDAIAVEGVMLHDIPIRIDRLLSATNAQIYRLTQLATDDLLESELSRDPLSWVALPSA